MWRLAVGLIGIALAVPLAGVLLLAAGTPVTVSGAAYLAAAVLVAGGLIAVLRWGRAALLVAAGGLLLALVVAGLRLSLAGRATLAPLQVVTLPAGHSSRWLNHLVDEQDLLLFGEVLLRRMGGVSRREHTGLVPALTMGYADLRAAQASFASPVLSTYLFWQRPQAFDAVVVEPEAGGAPLAGVIFLHGFMGNVSLQCWEIAQAVRPLGLVTVCPSAGWIGDWWRPGGAATLRASMAYLQARGVERLYLGGFSNGGVGLSRLAAQLADADGVSGLFFIAGVSHGPDIAAADLPVLIIQGAHDERLPAPAARQAAAAIGGAAQYVELEADHFLIVKQADEVQSALSAWLAAREAAR